jgi:hypothetical protein
LPTRPSANINNKAMEFAFPNGKTA